MLRKWLCQADVTIVLEPIDPILIKSGYATQAVDMEPVSTFRNGKLTYYFPGTSLKGVLRSHMERMARTLHPGSVCLPYYDHRKGDNDISIPVQEEERSFGCGFWVRDGSSAEAYSDSCAACRMFGSLKFGGRFSIGDALPQEKSAPSPELRNNVAIDRFTGGAKSGALFNMRVLVGGKFKAQLRLMNFELWQLAALNSLLQDMEDEMLTIGSGRSRGLGRIRGRVTEYHLSYVRTVTVDHLVGLYQLVSAQERKAYDLHAWQPDVDITLPQPAVRGLRHLYALETDGWSRQLQVLQPALDQFLQWHGGPKAKAPAKEPKVA